eukprot:gene14042-biopygen366
MIPFGGGGTGGWRWEEFSRLPWESGRIPKGLGAPETCSLRVVSDSSGVLGVLGCIRGTLTGAENGVSSFETGHCYGGIDDWGDSLALPGSTKMSSMTLADDAWKVLVMACYDNHRFHKNSVQFRMNSCHEEGQNRAGIEAAGIGIERRSAASIPARFRS